MGIDMVRLSHSLVLYYSHTQILQAEVRASLCRNDAKREMVPDPNAPRFGHMAPRDSERRRNLEERMDPSRSLHPDYWFPAAQSSAIAVFLPLIYYNKE